MRTPTADEIDDVLYSARAGDVDELRSALAAFAAEGAAPLSDAQLAQALDAAANETGNTALLYAAANGHMGECRAEVELCHAAVAPAARGTPAESTVPRWRLPPRLAARVGTTCSAAASPPKPASVLTPSRAEVLSYLLPKLKLDAVLRANDAGNTAVHWAALNGHLPAVQALVQRIEELSPRPVESGAGADEEEDEEKAAERSPWDARNKAGRGPMSEAQMAGKEDVVKWLLERMIGGPTPAPSKEEVGEDTPAAPQQPAAAAQPAQQDAAVDAATNGVQDAELK
jgi:ankyrin repeat protein